ncbi:hypothetical protein SEVIR_9G080451v4 [Setaria viridis]
MGRGRRAYRRTASVLEPEPYEIAARSGVRTPRALPCLARRIKFRAPGYGDWLPGGWWQRRFSTGTTPIPCHFHGGRRDERTGYNPAVVTRLEDETRGNIYGPSPPVIYPSISSSCPPVTTARGARM